MVAVWCSGPFGLPETVLKQSCDQYKVTTEPNPYNTCFYRERQKFFEWRNDNNGDGILHSLKLSKEFRDDYRAWPSAVSRLVRELRILLIQYE